MARFCWLTSRTHMWATSRFTSRTLPSSSSNSALSRGKPSVSSKRTRLPLVHPSRLHLSPSASSLPLSPRGRDQHLSHSGSSRLLSSSSSSSASSQHRALPRGDQRLPGLQLQHRGGNLSQEV